MLDLPGAVDRPAGDSVAVLGSAPPRPGGPSSARRDWRQIRRGSAECCGEASIAAWDLTAAAYHVPADRPLLISRCCATEGDLRDGDAGEPAHDRDRAS